MCWAASRRYWATLSCVISASYMLSISDARTSPLPYLYFCMRTKFRSFFPSALMSCGNRESKLQNRHVFFMKQLKVFFSLSKLRLEISLHYDTTWLSHNVSCAYLIAPSEGTIILKDTDSTLLQQTVKPVSSQKLHGHHTNLAK